MDHAAERLRRLVVGTSVVRVEYGDYWTLRTDADIWILAQHVDVSLGDQIAEAIRARVPEALATVDPGIVPVAAGLFSVMRRPIREVRLDDAGSCALHMGSAWVSLGVDVDVVDWQWSFARMRAIPHSSFEVACFYRGEVQMSLPSGG